MKCKTDERSGIIGHLKPHGQNWTSFSRESLDYVSHVHCGFVDDSRKYQF